MTAAELAARSPLAVARQRNLTQPISAAQPGGQGRPARAEHSEPRVPGMSFEIGGESPVLGP
jgi:hypothetical protein